MRRCAEAAAGERRRGRADTQGAVLVRPDDAEARFDKPGKSPFMDMELVPRYADEADHRRRARTRRSDQAQQALGRAWQR